MTTLRTTVQPSIRLTPRPIMELITVTPELASGWLEKNTNFRQLDDKRVQRLARDIIQDRFDLTGDTIKFDADGNLRDGQHRLTAVVRAKKPAQMYVFRGLVSDRNVDNGVRRTFSQHLAALGVPQYNRVASAVALLFRYRNGTAFSVGGHGTGTVSELLDLYHAESNIIDGVRAAERVVELFPMSAVSVWYHIVSPRRKAEADRFLELLDTGAGLNEGDPALHLREQALNYWPRARGGVTGPTKFALFIKAWNMWLAGTPCRLLKWSAVGPSAEPFPSITC